MKGDFSRWALDAADNLTGVLSQQGRVFTDPDITALTQIAGHWRETLGRDAIGAAVVAVPGHGARDHELLAAVVAPGWTAHALGLGAPSGRRPWTRR